MTKISLILIGLLLFLAAFTVVSKQATVDSSMQAITLTKRIEKNDPPCLQMYYYIEHYADSFDVPRSYAFGLAYAETHYGGPFHWQYNHKQKSPSGAVGPMQIMPATAKMVDDIKIVSTQKLRTNIEYNVRVSMKLVRQLYDKYGNWEVAFGCYNTGRPCINSYAKGVVNYEPKW